ncbi:prepilin-type N-terminal cleavage/methylation domain-containing protein [Neorhodopirellula lusitana]|uniref:Prepilin-type N-terminal cleavage/methylation domain-containing protein n=1 Tax=Neorhodopirellula lusitana TaxID=445327 RepID=A0ABY1QP26_9BACT|nr:prepilin-type N-terminal cleavage/methylation domain-containing protein [Neorhodopirellula lusitana]SMP76796.1 prepilin-type N-terminal cleavage/methylation domain-containing protein [Neorhodopirellula lusitana]
MTLSSLSSPVPHRSSGSVVPSSSTPNSRGPVSLPTSPPQRQRPGFTLVELMVVIAIIGVLAAALVPAINGVISRAKVASIKLETGSIASAIDQYNLKYGDFPPDFSDKSVIDRHYRKLFSRMTTEESGLLDAIVGTGASFNPTIIDRAESLVWCLGGYSEDIQRPFTGPGGPLQWVGSGTYAAATSAERQTPANYQINTDRINKLFDFDTGRLTIDTDSVNAGAALSPTNRYLSTDDGDLFPTYRSREDGAPFVYFDSRTYAKEDATLGMNGYGGAGFGAIRPYISGSVENITTTGNFTSLPQAITSWQFMNPDTFQVISAGLDDNFGAANMFDPGEGTNRPAYYQYPSGSLIAPRLDVATPGDLIFTGVSKYQEGNLTSSANHFAPDNIANFSGGAMVDDIP